MSLSWIKGIIDWQEVHWSSKSKGSKRPLWLLYGAVMNYYWQAENLEEEVFWVKCLYLYKAKIRSTKIQKVDISPQPEQDNAVVANMASNQTS